ncbi:MAG: hypothetical protein J0H83_05885 [Candidatus Melainabacteria bacterium]|jgi:hypothetical protein|nr:hypothetical protein [Candidatus Melainabacteria bacterium]
MRYFYNAQKQAIKGLGRGLSAIALAIALALGPILPALAQEYQQASWHIFHAHLSDLGSPNDLIAANAEIEQALSLGSDYLFPQDITRIMLQLPAVLTCSDALGLDAQRNRAAALAMRAADVPMADLGFSQVEALRETAITLHFLGYPKQARYIVDKLLAGIDGANPQMQITILLADAQLALLKATGTAQSKIDPVHKQRYIALRNLLNAYQPMPYNFLAGAAFATLAALYERAHDYPAALDCSRSAIKNILQRENLSPKDQDELRRAAFFKNAMAKRFAAAGKKDLAKSLDEYFVQKTAGLPADFAINANLPVVTWPYPDNNLNYHKLIDQCLRTIAGQPRPAIDFSIGLDSSQTKANVLRIARARNLANASAAAGNTARAKVRLTQLAALTDGWQSTDKVAPLKTAILLNLAYLDRKPATLAKATAFIQKSGDAQSILLQQAQLLRTSAKPEQAIWLLEQNKNQMKSGMAIIAYPEECILAYLAAGQKPKALALMPDLFAHKGNVQDDYLRILVMALKKHHLQSQIPIVARAFSLDKLDDPAFYRCRVEAMPAQQADLLLDVGLTRDLDEMFKVTSLISYTCHDSVDSIKMARYAKSKGYAAQAANFYCLDVSREMRLYQNYSSARRNECLANIASAPTFLPDMLLLSTMSMGDFSLHTMALYKKAIDRAQDLAKQNHDDPDDQIKYTLYNIDKMQNEYAVAKSRIDLAAKLVHSKSLIKPDIEKLARTLIDELEKMQAKQFQTNWELPQFLQLETFQENNRLDLAIQVLTKALEVDRTAVAANNGNSFAIVTPASLLADYYLRQNDADQAIAALQTCFAAAEKQSDLSMIAGSYAYKSGNEYVDFIRVAANRAAKSGDTRATSKVCAAAIDHYLSQNRPQAPNMVLLQLAMARLQDADGQNAKAVELRRKANELQQFLNGTNASKQDKSLEIAYAIPPEPGRDVFFARSARQALEYNLALYQAERGVLDDVTQRSLHDLVRYYVQYKDYNAAIKLQKSYIDQQKPIVGKSSARIYQEQLTLATILLAAGKTKEAKDMLGSLVAWSADNGGNGKDLRIAALFKELGDNEKAMALSDNKLNEAAEQNDQLGTLWIRKLQEVTK